MRKAIFAVMNKAGKVKPVIPLRVSDAINSLYAMLKLPLGAVGEPPLECFIVT
jgi:hypothetical protein